MYLDFEPFFRELMRLFALPTLWEVVSGALIPIAAISIAAFFVIKQLRQAESHRSNDRKANAAVELSDLLLANADLVVSIVTEAGKGLGEGLEITTMDKYRLNRHYIKACAHLPPEDIVVANWVQDKAQELFTIPDRMILNGFLLPAPGEPHGPIRSAVTDTSTAALKTLLLWSNGDLDAVDFSHQFDPPQFHNFLHELQHRISSP